MIGMVVMTGIGGFIGSSCRYLTGIAARKIFGSAYPWGTFAVNVIGCFIIGLFIGIYLDQDIDSFAKALFKKGFCGGYTTFSSFSLDNYKLLQKGEYVKFLLYVIPSVAIGLFMVWLGITITH